MAEAGQPVVLDASALLAYLQAEPGAARVEDLLLTRACHISTVNLAEVLTRLADWQVPLTEAETRIAELGLTFEPFDAGLARRATDLRQSTRAKGLSLGDRACLALTQDRGALALTADRAWQGLSLGLAIEFIR